MNRFTQLIFLTVMLVFVYSSQASEETIGPKGINSIATGLNGMNSLIGQVEGGRPGVVEYDPDPNCCNDKVVPAVVYARHRIANPNESLTDHALWVASVMISQQDFFGPGGGGSKPVGVAPQATLSSSAYITNDPGGILQEDAAIAAQTLTPIAYATNMSFGVPLDNTQLDGTSTLTSFVDWSTVFHEVLYVVAGNEVLKIQPVSTVISTGSPRQRQAEQMTACFA